MGHAAWLEEVWVHLLTNGIQSGGEPPRLYVGATVQPNRYVRLWVRDNGPGLRVEMDRAIQEVGQHVEDAAGLTAQVSASAGSGAQAVEETIRGIAEIRLQTPAAKHAIEELASRIQRIGEFVNVIGAINEETNLLSLNAAIIAAQAGEQGKAFAVVANHVKTLAQRTAGATQEIERLIHAVQDESRNAVQATGSGMQAVESGVERSRRAGSALSAIRSSAHDASARVAEIARAATEQTRNSAHVRARP